MKKTALSLFAVLAALQFSYAQTNTYPTNGNVGIGTSTPQTKLDVNGANDTITFSVYNSDTSGSTLTRSETAMIITNNGTNTIPNEYKMAVNGVVVIAL